jgi:hypothetical protein
MKYAIEAENEDQAFEIFKKDLDGEFVQCHLGEEIVDITPVTEKEYIEIIDKDPTSQYMKNWSAETKLDLVIRDVQN